MWEKFFKKERGFDSYLPYIGFVGKSVLFLKTGGFCTTYEIRGHDLSSSTEYELGHVSKIINSALKDFGDGWIANIDTVRKEIKYYPSESECFFPDPVTLLIDSSRRQIFESEDSCFENKYYLTLTYTPPSALTKKMMFMFSSEDNKGNENGLEKPLKKFEESIDKFINIFSSAIISKRLNDEEMLTYIHSCITGLNHRVAVPIIPMYVDTILSSKDFIGGFKPKIGDKFIKVISIKSFPSYLHTGILDILNNLVFEYRFASRFIFLDQATSRKFIEDKRKDWDQSKTSFKNILRSAFSPPSSTTFLSDDSINMAFEANNAANENQKNEIGFGFYTATIILMNEDQEILDNNAKEVLKTMERLGFPCLIESINSVDAYLSSIPAISYANVRKPLISTHNLSHIMPLTASWSGDAEHPNPKYKSNVDFAPPMFYAASEGRTPFRCSLHVSDIGHTLIIGPTGSGKTSLLGFIAAQQFRYKNSRIFMFDKLRSQYVLCKASNGSFFEISPENNEHDEQKISFCPLADIDDINGRTWVIEWITTVIELQKNGEKLSLDQHEAIAQTINLMSKETNRGEQRRLSKFVSQVQDQEIRQALYKYIDPEQFGSIFDGSQDFIANSKFCVFETNNLMDKGEDIILPALTYLFREIEKTLDGSPTFIILDEAWTFLSHSTFTKKIEKWLREMRRSNCAVVFATQSVSEIRDSPIVSVILESCKTKIYLPNPPAKQNELLWQTYQSFGLNNKQIDIIASAQPKRHYYLNSESGNKLFEILLDKLTLSFVGASDKSEIDKAKDLISKHKESWVSEWLKYNKVAEDWIDYFEIIQRKMANISQS